MKEDEELLFVYMNDNHIIFWFGSNFLVRKKTLIKLKQKRIDERSKIFVYRSCVGPMIIIIIVYRIGQFSSSSSSTFT